MKKYLKVLATLFAFAVVLTLTLCTLAEEAAEGISEVMADVVAPVEEAIPEPAAEEPVVTEAPTPEPVAETPVVTEAPAATEAPTSEPVVETPVVTEAPAATEAPTPEPVVETPVVTEAPAATEAPTPESVAETPVATEAPTEEATATPEATEVPEETPAVDYSNVSVEVVFAGSAEVHLGDTVKLQAVITGLDDVAYTMQWQYKDSQGWHDISGANDMTYSFKVDSESINYQWQIVVTTVD